MMQTFRITDVVRSIVQNAPGGPNLACPRMSVCGSKAAGNTALWKDTLARQHDRVSLVQWDGLRLGALVSARTRTGFRAWEIDRLFISSANAPAHKGIDSLTHDEESVVLELLERVVQEAGSQSAQRVFLRLPSASPLEAVARRTGFFPYLEETLMESNAGGDRPIDSKDAPNMRPSLPEDSYPLFQLFTSATPQAVRAVTGLTHEQWCDAQERPHHRKDWVITDSGRITARLLLDSTGQVEIGEVLVHPSHPEQLAPLLETAAAQPKPQRWLVPDYQESTARMLSFNGFREISRYTMFAKSVVAPVMDHEMTPMEA